MISRILFATLCLALAFGSTACRSSKKKDKFENKPAAEMEANFRKRWVDKRCNELVSSGVAQAEAQSRADREFVEQFIYTGGLKSK